MGTRRLLGHVVNWKIASITLAVCALVVVGIVVAHKRAATPITVTLRLAVNPPERSKVVKDYASSARFKYEMGKKSGLKPVLAQKLSVKSVPNSSEIEAAVGVETREQAQRYADVFVATLQDLCGKEAQLTLVNTTTR